MSSENNKKYYILDSKECYYHFQQKEQTKKEIKQIPETFSSIRFEMNNSNQPKVSSFRLNKFKEFSCSKMFSYTIGRLNWDKNDLEMKYQGYSQGYLDLLGLDEQSFINLTLRDKEIDLVRDPQDITMYSALQMNQKMSGMNLDEDSLNIVTFDGFPIKIFQKQKKIIFNEFQNYSLPELIFSITEIEVDLNDLQNLKNYRLKLATQQNTLPIDIFIQRELSYKFEDVEYSVHSENFIDKYYKENLISLQNIRQHRIETNQERTQVRQLKTGDSFISIEVISKQKK